MVCSLPAKSAVCSPDGTKLAAVTEAGVDLFNLSNGAKLLSLAVPGVVLLDWSSTGAYITTAQRPSKQEDGQPAKNIKAWDTATGAVVLELGVKSVNKENWPLLHWAQGDDAAFHGVTNTVHQYSRASGFKTAKKIPIKGVCTFQPCPAPGKQLLAAFIAESKGQPAVATVVDCSGEQPVTISRKSFYRATGASIMWNTPSTACLVMATCETDATNQSYYGESKLHYLPAEAARADDACAVAMPKDGPVHDVQWSPAGDFFVVVAGFMPAKVMLLDNRCKPVYDLGSGPYNIARWNPFGRFLAIAGFGNLPGDVVFYNKLNKGVCKQMGATRSGSAVTASWSPCGRYLLTATTAPRLRVDNNVRVFNYIGDKVCERPFETLLEAAWLPPPPGTTYEDRPPSPERLSAANRCRRVLSSSANKQARTQRSARTRRQRQAEMARQQGMMQRTMKQQRARTVLLLVLQV
ncbi:eukaryotic translation initiation factor eIF2A-domain-containing protein [Scenedesmus sp. NREL 46B-D3]|nr:eukaryotic translation initiation factor eIF2A-domain-containing protein [Scenedesmus sp. NREL 46B-D3]